MIDYPPVQSCHGVLFRAEVENPNMKRAFMRNHNPQWSVVATVLEDDGKSVAFSAGASFPAMEIDSMVKAKSLPMGMRLRHDRTGKVVTLTDKGWMDEAGKRIYLK